MNFGQEDEDDSSSKEIAAIAAAAEEEEEEAVADYHQLQPEDEEEDEEENDELDEEEEDDYDEDGLVAATAAASAIPDPNLHFLSTNNPSSKSSPSSAASPSVIQYKNFLPQHHAGFRHNLSQTSSDATAPSPTAFNFDDRRIDFVDLSLGSSNETDPDLHRGGAGPSSSPSVASVMVEKEHMFDKVVTPSDVGKLNRLVIPKQHAEKYFPLDSSSNEKGLLLNFEDRNGKPWRFRYSYWNSSQSYVMTKGWSRFVKENKLNAGDIVSFQRGVGESGKLRFYIDWRRRPNAPDPLSFHHHFDLQNQLHFPQSVRWGRLYSLPGSLSTFPPSSARQYDYPHPPPPPPPHHHPHHQFHHQQLNYGTIHHLQNPYGQTQYYHNYQHQQQQQQQYNWRPPGATAQYPIAASAAAAGGGMGGGEYSPMVIDSVPVVHGNTVGKRLRLFGVNMECQPPQTDDVMSFSPAAPSSSSLNVTYPHQQRGTMVGSIPSPHHYYLSSSSPSSTSSSSSSIPPLQFQGVPAAATATSGTSHMAMHHRQQQQQHEYSKKGKTSSLSFDLDL